MTMSCRVCGAETRENGWCRVCGGSYAGSHDFYEETKGLLPGQRINRSVDRFDGPKPAQRGTKP